MSSRGSALALAAAGGLSLASALPAGAITPARVGAEFQVNAYTWSAQFFPDVAMAADGDFIVVWEGFDTPGGDTTGSILGRRFAQNGAAQGADFQINSYTTNTQRRPSVAADADGDFVVVWESVGSVGTDTPIPGGFSIQGQRYASDGTARGAQFQVNAYTTGSQHVPSVSAAPDGDFVVVWTSFGSPATSFGPYSIQGQRFASDGSTQGAQFQVNTYSAHDSRFPSVSVAAGGDFVVVWDTYGSPGTDTGISGSVQARRYASDGSALGLQFQVNTYTTDDQEVPHVATAGDGSFVVVWGSEGSSGTDANGWSVQGQRYASGGSVAGAEFQVNTDTTDNQFASGVAASADGSFVVTWTSYGSSGTDSSYASTQGQRYVSDGSARGAEFQVNTYTTYRQYRSSVAADTESGFVVVWTGYGSLRTDSSSYSVQGQRYSLVALAARVPATSSATRFALAAALLLLGAAYALRRRA
jgi:hypothetical protein